eukprot:GFUD01042807.1.p1 GENE.GFUD01042807.1~~GFUD01042807.1.p1  ORF type:complete len:288 (+),score=62.85 GFUD01042807.1:44-907(+)
MNMDAEMFNLTWDDFQHSAKETFRSLVHEEDFMDVTLVCDDDKQLRAHKVILGSCSSFFKNILLKNPHPSPLLFISGVHSRELKAILNFMYLGETNVEQCHLDSFMAACKIIKVKGLTEVVPQEQQINNLPEEKEKIPLPRPSAKTPNTPTAMVKSENTPNISPPKVKAENVYTEQTSAVANFEQSYDVPSYHNSSFEGRFWCNKCDFQSGSKNNLKRHDEMKHQGIKYPCDGCEYKASSKDNLKRHSQNKHEGVTFDCNECDFNSSTKGSIRRHKINLHSAQIKLQ